MTHRLAVNIPIKSCSNYGDTQSPVRLGEDHELRGTLALAMTEYPTDDGLAHTEYCAPQSFVSETKAYVDSAALPDWQLLFKTVNNQEPSELYDSSTNYGRLADLSAISAPVSILESSDYKCIDSSDNEQAFRPPDYFPVASAAYIRDPPADAFNSQDSSLLVLNSAPYTKFSANLTLPCTSDNKGSQEAVVNSDLWSSTSNSASQSKTLSEMSPMQIEAFLQQCGIPKADLSQQLKHRIASTKTDKQQSDICTNCTVLSCECDALNCRDLLDRDVHKPKSPFMAHCDGRMTSTFIGRSNNRIIGINNAAKANPPRPSNAFILFRCGHQREMQQMHPDKTMQEISKMLGDIWNQEPEDSELKQRFKRLAATEREVHKKIWPNYKYTCGKRRARTKNKKTKGEHVTEFNKNL